MEKRSDRKIRKETRQDKVEEELIRGERGEEGGRKKGRKKGTQEGKEEFCNSEVNFD